MLIRSMFNIQSMSMDLLSGGFEHADFGFFLPLHYPSQNVIKGQSTIVWVEFSGGTLIPCSVLPHDQPTLRVKANQKREKKYAINERVTKTAKGASYKVTQQNLSFTSILLWLHCRYFFTMFLFPFLVRDIVTWKNVEMPRNDSILLLFAHSIVFFKSSSIFMDTA